MKESYRVVDKKDRNEEQAPLFSVRVNAIVRFLSHSRYRP